MTAHQEGRAARERLTINKRERKYLKPLAVFHWEIFETVSGRFLLDDDICFPVNVGPVANSLIGKGLIEECGGAYDLKRYRATHLTRKLLCGECYKGDFISDDGVCEGPCPHCDGTGLLLTTERRGDG